MVAQHKPIPRKPQSNNSIPPPCVSRQHLSESADNFAAPPAVRRLQRTASRQEANTAGAETSQRQPQGANTLWGRTDAADMTIFDHQGGHFSNGFCHSCFGRAASKEQKGYLFTSITNVLCGAAFVSRGSGRAGCHVTTHVRIALPRDINRHINIK